MLQLGQKPREKESAIRPSSVRNLMSVRTSTTRSCETTRLKSSLISSPDSSILRSGRRQSRYLMKSWKALFYQSSKAPYAIAHSLSFQKKLMSTPRILVSSLCSLHFIKPSLNVFIELLRAISKQENLLPCLITIDKRYKPEQIEPIHTLLGKLNELGTIFLSLNTYKQQADS